MSQAKLLWEMLAREHDVVAIVEVAATIIASLELMLAKERRRTEKAHALPQDWTLPDEGRSYALKLGWAEARVGAEAARFRNWAHAKGVKYIDWAAAWRNWCDSPLQENNGHVQRNNNRVSNGSQQPSDLKVQRKERMSNAIDQLRLFGEGDLQPRASSAANSSNVVRLPAAGG